MLLVQTTLKHLHDNPDLTAQEQVVVPALGCPHRSLIPSRLKEESRSAQLLPVTTASVHANSVLELRNGDLACVWFGGSKEGASDVGIYLSLYQKNNPQTKAWSPALLLLDREILKSRYGIRWIRKIGNPVLHQDAKGLFHLFVVTVSVGGWAASRIEHFVCLKDNLLDWHYRGRLPISPWPNISHLVRAPAVNTAGGGFILPAYYELGEKYGVLLRFNADGFYHDKLILQSPSSAHRLIQPWPVCHSDGSIGFFFRDNSRYPQHRRRIHFCTRTDLNVNASEGNSDCLKHHIQALSLSNPDASVAAIAIADGGYWLVRNPDTPEYRWRHGLVLERLDAQFRIKETLWLERGDSDSEFSYPTILAAQNGLVHIIYTHNRKTFRHRVFSSA
jgi:predicted neuraminidase